MANAELKRKEKEYEAAGKELKGEDRRKVGQQALNRARSEVSAVSRRDRNIEITDREWEAIQKGAITETKLKSILNNTDIDKLRERATPKTTRTLSTSKINHIKAMENSNYTIAEIAERVGVSPSVVSKYLKGKE